MTTQAVPWSPPVELHSLEMKLVWGDALLEERIDSGKNPFAEIL